MTLCHSMACWGPACSVPREIEGVGQHCLAHAAYRHNGVMIGDSIRCNGAVGGTAVVVVVAVVAAALVVVIV